MSHIYVSEFLLKDSIVQVIFDQTRRPFSPGTTWSGPTAAAASAAREHSGHNTMRIAPEQQLNRLRSGKWLLPKKRRSKATMI
jgi:hypothetical protein